jgi:predicted alpha/beta-hydrolase family hydrolase
MYPPASTAEVGHLDAEIAQDQNRVFNVSNGRDIMEDNRLVRQQTSGQEFEGSVFVSAYSNFAMSADCPPSIINLLIYFLNRGGWPGNSVIVSAPLRRAKRAIITLMPIITLDGLALHYFELGPRDSPLKLLFIHGAASSLDIWTSTLTGLTEFHSIAIDLPGHGRSKPPGRRAIEQYALIIERFVVALNLENVVLVGHSMGSAIALTVAQRSLIQIRGLILFGASARMPVGDALLGGSLTALESVAAFIAGQGIVDAPTDQRESVARQVLACGGTTTFGDFLACNRFDLRAKTVDTGRSDPCHRRSA